MGEPWLQPAPQAAHEVGLWDMGLSMPLGGTADQNYNVAFPGASFQWPFFPA